MSLHIFCTFTECHLNVKHFEVQNDGHLTKRAKISVRMKAFVKQEHEYVCNDEGE